MADLLVPETGAMPRSRNARSSPWKVAILGAAAVEERTVEFNQLCLGIVVRGNPTQMKSARELLPPYRPGAQHRALPLPNRRDVR